MPLTCTSGRQLTVKQLIDYVANHLQGPEGPDGKSAYEVYKVLHPNATEQQFFNSLAGPAGHDGLHGVDAYHTWVDYMHKTQPSLPATELTEAKWVASMIGPRGHDGHDGKSAYDIWKAQSGNHNKTFPDFLAEITGPQGPQGIQGKSGTGLVIKGTVANAAALPTAGSANPPKDGDAFFTTDTGDLYMYNGKDHTWHDMGHIQGPQGPQGQKGDKGDKGHDGAGGKSAYELWKGQVGNSGKTIQQFLSSIIGSQGLHGVDGKSAYQIWVDLGNTGKTEQEFIDGLKGAKGDTGPAGSSGYQTWKNWKDPHTGQQPNIQKSQQQYFASITGNQGIQGIQGIAGHSVYAVSSKTELAAVPAVDGNTLIITGGVAPFKKGDIVLHEGGHWVVKGNIEGANGSGYTDAQIEHNGHLTVEQVAPDGSKTKQDLGLVKGADGKGFQAAHVKNDGFLYLVDMAGTEHKIGPEQVKGMQGVRGQTGVGYTHASIDATGHLLLTPVDHDGHFGTPVTVGMVKGADGQGIHLQGTVNTKADLPTYTGTDSVSHDGIVHMVKADGNLYVWHDHSKTWENIGHIQGPTGPKGRDGIDGKGFTTATITMGHLILTDSLNKIHDLGIVVGSHGANGANGENGTGYVDASIDATTHHLFLTPVSKTGVKGTPIDLGMVQGPKGDQGPAGGAGVAGPKGADGVVHVVTTTAELAAVPKTAGNAVLVTKPFDSYHIGDVLTAHGATWNPSGSIIGPAGGVGPIGPHGPTGKSSYELWKAQTGNGSKTLNQFLDAYKGHTGDKGDGYTLAALNTHGHLILTDSHGVTHDLGLVTGSKGAKGDSGAGLMVGSVYKDHAEMVAKDPHPAVGTAHLVTSTGTLWIYEPAVAGHAAGYHNIGHVQGPKGDKGDKGDAGATRVQPMVADKAHLPPNGNVAFDIRHVENECRDYVWDGTAWHVAGTLIGPKGDRGDAGLYASQPEVDAGLVSNKIVSPLTLQNKLMKEINDHDEAYDAIRGGVGANALAKGFRIDIPDAKYGTSHMLNIHIVGYAYGNQAVINTRIVGYFYNKAISSASRVDAGNLGKFDIYAGYADGHAVLWVEGRNIYYNQISVKVVYTQLVTTANKEIRLPVTITEGAKPSLTAPNLIPYKAIPVTIAAGWLAYAGFPLEMRCQGNIVTLSGLIKSTSMKAGMLEFPIEYAPSHSIITPIAVSAVKDSLVGYEVPAVYIQNDGTHGTIAHALGLLMNKSCNWVAFNLTWSIR